MTWNGHDSQNNIAKLGYILDMKVRKKNNPSICLDLYSNLFVKSGKFGAFSSMRNALYRLKSYYERNTVVDALLTFHKPGPMSLIQYFFLASRKLFNVNKSMLK
jgi:hypothetical protein